MIIAWKIIFLRHIPYRTRGYSTIPGNKIASAQADDAAGDGECISACIICREFAHVTHGQHRTPCISSLMLGRVGPVRYMGGGGGGRGGVFFPPAIFDPCDLQVF